MREPTRHEPVLRLRAARPVVTPRVIDATDCPWGWYVQFAGTRRELIAAGVADEDMLRTWRGVLPGLARGVRRDEYGDTYEARRQKRGGWIITRYFWRQDKRCTVRVLKETQRGRAAVAAVKTIIAKLTRAPGVKGSARRPRPGFFFMRASLR